MQNALPKTFSKDRDTASQNLASTEASLGYHRIPGYDLARGLAVLMMVFINFGAFFPDPEDGSGMFKGFVDLLDRRAAVILVMVSGAGLSLMTRDSACDADTGQLPGYIRKRLLNRSLFLIVFGYLLSMAWSGDILHFYGIFIFAGIYFLNKNNRTLLYAIVGCWLLTFFQHIDGVGGFLQEPDNIFLTPFKEIFFTGYFPVFPWAIFFLVGMFVGRISIRHGMTQTGMLILSLPLIVSEALLIRLSSCFPEQYGPYFLTVISGISDSLPFSVLSGIGTGLAGVLSGTLLSNFDMFRKNNFLTLLGKTSLTFYVFHVFFICIVLLLPGLNDFQPSPVPVICLFMMSYLLFLRFWLKRNPRGPLEMFMRQFDPAMKSTHK